MSLKSFQRGSLAYAGFSLATKPMERNFRFVYNRLDTLGTGLLRPIARGHGSKFGTEPRRGSKCSAHATNISVASYLFQSNAAQPFQNIDFAVEYGLLIVLIYTAFGQNLPDGKSL